MASLVEIAGLAYNAGIRNPAKLAQAAAIAHAESGGNPNAIGDTTLQNATWGPSVGLWQIRSLKAEKGKGTIRDADALKNPAHNAKAMFEISRGGATWEPWTVTHLSNPLGRLRYQAALPAATAAASQVIATKGVAAGAAAAGDAVDAVTDPARELAATVSDAVQTPARIANWLTEPGTWTRIGFFGLGAMFLIAGLVLVVKGPMMSAVPVGKVAKAVGKVVK